MSDLSKLIVCTPFLLGGEGVEPPTKLSKRGGGGLDKISIFIKVLLGKKG